eukprot:PhF_6_TR12622/c2_g1_i4/m.19962
MFGWVTKVANNVSSVAMSAVDVVVGHDPNEPTTPDVIPSSTDQQEQPKPQTAKPSSLSWGARLLFDVEDTENNGGGGGGSSEKDLPGNETMVAPPATTTNTTTKPHESEAAFVLRHGGVLFSLGKSLIERAADTALNMLPEIEDTTTQPTTATPTTKESITSYLQALHMKKSRISKEYGSVSSVFAVDVAKIVGIVELVKEDPTLAASFVWVSKTASGAQIALHVATITGGASGASTTDWSSIVNEDVELALGLFRKECNKLAQLSSATVSRVVVEALRVLGACVDEIPGGVLKSLDWPMARGEPQEMFDNSHVAFLVSDVVRFTLVQSDGVVQAVCGQISALQQSVRKIFPQELHARVKEIALESRSQCHLFGGEVMAYFEEAMEYLVPVLALAVAQQQEKTNVKQCEHSESTQAAVVAEKDTTETTTDEKQQQQDVMEGNEEKGEGVAAVSAQDADEASVNNATDNTEKQPEQHDVAAEVKGEDVVEVVAPVPTEDSEECPANVEGPTSVDNTATHAVEDVAVPPASPSREDEDVPVAEEGGRGGKKKNKGGKRK